MKFIAIFILYILSAACVLKNDAVSYQSAVIFGENDLKETTHLTGPFKKNSSAVAAMVNKRSIGIGNQGFEFLPDKKARKFCDGSDDGHAECTGFLVAPQLLLTAGHCYQSDKLNPVEECRKFSWVFDYQNNSLISTENLYHCRKVLALETSENGPDYALIELDRKVTNRAPVELDFAHKLQFRQEVYLIGHALGRPLTYSGIGQVYTINEEYQFQTMLDGFSGNSGAPVFDLKTHKVIGIHVAGEGKELTFNQAQGCYELNHCIESVLSPCAFSVELKLFSLEKIQEFLPHF